MKVKNNNKNKSGRVKKVADAIKTRKELRKDQRKEKKAKRHAFFQRKQNMLQGGESDFKEAKSADSGKKKTTGKIKQEVGQAINTVATKIDGVKGSSIKKTNLLYLQEQNKIRKDKQEERRKKQYNKIRIKQMKEANEEEDKIIKKLEKQLKLNKRKSKTVPKSFALDGLDYLLEVCDEANRQNVVAAEQNLQDFGSDFEEDLAIVTGKPSSKAKQKSEEVISDEFSDDSLQASDWDCSETEQGGGMEDNEKMGYVSDGESSSDNMTTSDLGENRSDENEANTESSTNLKNNKLSRDTFSKVKSKRNTNNLNNLIHQDSINENIDSPKHIIRKGNKGKSKSGETIILKNKTNKINKLDKKHIVDNGEISEDETDINKGQSCGTKAILTECDSLRTETHQKMSSKVLKRSKTCKAELKSKSVKFTDDLGSDDTSELDSDSEINTKGSGDELWEDIYGRTRNKQGNIIHSGGKYIPPHLRAQGTETDSKKKEQLIRLRKQLKGLLNRLAENNMNSIAVQFEELYMLNSRNDMNETLTQLMVESLIAPVSTPERLVMEHVLLITVLHANVGTEVGAYFLQVMIKKFQEMYEECHEVENKLLDNIVLILAHLYNFKVFHCVLMFDVLDKLATKFEEKEVELILVVLRSVGLSLRKDDPAALKDLILRLQQQAATHTHMHNTRVKFMLDILLAIKNNNVSKIPNYDTSHSEHLKKLLKGFLRKGNYVTELKISLEDLLKAEERGRWWVVGSAWTGVLPGEINAATPDTTTSDRTSSQPSALYSQQLMDLAKKQRMNTDVRRNIFCILMTAEDYLDAFEKLLHLGLKNQQEREIVHVLMHCCLQEKQFNPYYGVLAQKLCDYDRKFQMTLQFSLWDRLKELSTMKLQQTSNLAKLLTHLLLEKGLPISVLKVVQFVDIDKPAVRFLRQVLLGVLLCSSEEVCVEVFQRTAQSAKLRMFRESLRLFIHHFLLRNTATLPANDVQTLEKRAKIADKILSLQESGDYLTIIYLSKRKINKRMYRKCKDANCQIMVVLEQMGDILMEERNIT
uniref:MI domain-containing protein n=1 Tax=Timema genevievae TaxID=629358 RepID=A0A7R9K143_TIMGE|nr:unnamed protein product [Timema genevievae]